MDTDESEVQSGGFAQGALTVAVRLQYRSQTMGLNDPLAGADLVYLLGWHVAASCEYTLVWTGMHCRFRGSVIHRIDLRVYYAAWLGDRFFCAYGGAAGGFGNLLCR